MKKNYITLFSLLFLAYSGHVWSQSNTPPQIIATGNQSYCPLSQINIVTDFNIIDPDDTEVEALYIQISTGYVNGQDILTLTNNHPNVITQWSNNEGKMTLRSSGSGFVSYLDLIAAVKDVIFESNSPEVSGEKFFSITIGDANYLPSTGHYYEYVPSIGITWTDAKVAAELRTYNGLPGYLATITSPEEAQLSGEQAAGAGWIGGSDAETEEVWKWVTGPEAGMVFWNGLFNGSAPNGAFAFWNTQEPNSAGNEDYVHVTAPNVGIPGSWNDLSNTGATSGDYQPKGYIVEYGYGGPQDVVGLSASTSIYVPAIDNIVPGNNCGPGTVVLSASATAGSVLWFESETGGAPIYTGNNFTTPLLSTTTNYYVLASENGCMEGDREVINATIYDIPVIEPFIDLKNCDDDGVPDGITIFNLEEANEFITLDDSNLSINYFLTFAEAESGSVSNVLDPYPFNNSTSNIVYARVENNNGCYDIATVNLQVSTTSIPSGYVEELVVCDDDSNNDGYYSFDLTQASQRILDLLPIQNLRVQYYRNFEDAQLELNEIIPQSNYTNETAYSENLYVRVESNDNGECYGIGPHVLLTVNPLPEFELPETAVVCQNLPPITVETLNPKDDYTYTWKDQSGNIISTQAVALVSSGGIYSVTATSESNCESIPRTINVMESIIADINLEDITIVDNSDSNTISINNQNNNLGYGDYEFSLSDNSDSYQDEPVFDNVDPGIHTVLIRDKLGCGIASIDVSVIGYPKFFTPNGDEINDTWQVDGVSFQPNSKIYIFDRFGKLLKQLDANGEGWDGFYNGNPMPSNDYWFMVQLEDGRTHKGHFSLIRR